MSFGVPALGPPKPWWEVCLGLNQHSDSRGGCEVLLKCLWRGLSRSRPRPPQPLDSGGSLG